MANIVFAPVVQAEINHAFAVTLYDFSVKGSRPLSPKFGAQGPIGMAKGQERVTFSFKFAVPATGLEFDWVTIAANPAGFTISFPIGAERHQLYGCQVSDRSVQNAEESGDVTYSVDGGATEWVRIQP